MRAGPQQQLQIDLTGEDCRFLRQHVYEHSGIVIDEGKEYLLNSRLAPVADQFTAGSLGALCIALRSSPAPPVRQAVIDALTTNETFFFRDLDQYEAMRTILLPELMKSRGKIRVWSAAVSSGQEAYSIAMIGIELGLAPNQLEILGTDLSRKMLDRARSGVFTQMEVNRGLPVKMLVKHFERAGSDWRIKDPVKQYVRFEPFDLRTSMRAYRGMDIILCRNVLIYFDSTTKKNVLEEIARVLAPDGSLMLGTTETILSLTSMLEHRMAGKAKVYRRAAA